MKITRKAFTLAEIMIVLTVIGVLTAILLPSARNSMPDEKAMKFKKAHNAFYAAIRELATSDKYYYIGDFSKKPDESTVSSVTYFCETLADVLSTKSISCSSNESLPSTWNYWVLDGSYSLATNKSNADIGCRDIASHIGAEIVLQDGTVIYQTHPKYKFSHPQFKALYNGFIYSYKTFCIDIDGIGKGEAPFGYGVRVDGKIMNGARAEAWLDGSILQAD